MKKPYITAHSGCDGTERDSMKSIDKASALGADIVEIDIRKGPDGNLYVSHDPVTAENMQEKSAVKEAFVKIRYAGLSVNCDMKEQGALYDLLYLASAYGLDKNHLILSGCVSPEQIARDPHLAEQARIYINLEEVWKMLYFAQCQKGYTEQFAELMNDPWVFLKQFDVPEGWMDEAIRFVKAYHLAGVNLPHRCLCETFVEKLQKTNTPFSVWTVNDAELIERCIRIGSENITTREAELALAVRSRVCKSEP